MSATQGVTYSGVPPYLSNYSTETDVGNKFGNSTLFTASTTPSASQVRDIITRKDSGIDQAFRHDFRLHQVTELYDAEGTGRRAGQIHLRNTPVVSIERCEFRQEGGTANGRDTWIQGVVGGPGEAAGVAVGANNTVAADYYWSYPERGMIWWSRLRFSLAQKFRVTYSYGYASTPDWVRDLSATMAAIECLNIFSGTFMPPEPLPAYEARFERDVQFLMTQGGIRPLAGTA